MRRAMAAGAALATATLVWFMLRGTNGDATGPVGQQPGVVPSAARHAPSRARAAVMPALDSDAIAAGLDEELVALASDIRIISVEADDVRVCAGQPVWLRARVEGAEDDWVARWVWPIDGLAGAAPGLTAQWVAAEPGTYPVRFQVVRSLERRRVGVLAEQELQVLVEDCGDEAGVLRIEQHRVGGRVDFTAVSTVGIESELTWDFGDGDGETSSSLRARHEYPILELGAEETRSYRVVVEAVDAHGSSLRATTNVAIRGQATPPAPPAVVAELGETVWDEQGSQWTHSLTIDNRERPDITWDRAERSTVHLDGHIDTRVLAFSDVVTLIEQRPGGGFVGTVSATDDEAGPTVQRIADQLFGVDAEREPIVLTWVVYERDDIVPSSEPAPAPRER